nr:polysaccharide biosynthesis PFTS motif protein [Leptospira santarosai]
MLLVLFLSFFFKIQVVRFSSKWIRRYFPFIKLLDWGEYYDEDSIETLRNNAADFYLSHFQGKSTRILNMFSIDFSPKINQVNCLFFEVQFILFDLSKKMNDIQFIENIYSKILINYFPEAREFLIRRNFRILNVFNVFLEVVELYLVCLFRVCWILLNLIIRIFQEPLKQKFKIINDAVNPNELNFGSNERSFLWFVNFESNLAKDMLFILPRLTEQQQVSVKQLGINYISYISDLSIFLSRSDRFFLIWKYVFKLLFDLSLIFRHLDFILINSMTSDLIIWNRFIQSQNLISYITSMSSIGSEKPLVVLLNSKNVKTIIYAYSANSFNYTEKVIHKDSYAYFCEVICSEFVVWHEEFKQFLLYHKYKGQVHISGPLMPGLEPEKGITINLREKYVPKGIQRKFIITIFDIPPLNLKSNTLLSFPWPDNNTEENLFIFLSDCIRLLELNEEVVLVYKPKRNLNINKFQATERIMKLLEFAFKSGRLITLDDKINPWFPVEICDLAIGMPFTSPVLVAMNKGKHFIFHDAANKAVYHRYIKLNNHITHSFDQLKEEVLKILYNKDKVIFEKDNGFLESNLSSCTSKLIEILTTQRRSNQ